MATIDPGKILLTFDDIEAWRLERHDIEQMVRELHDRAAMLDERLNHAAYFAAGMLATVSTPFNGDVVGVEDSSVDDADGEAAEASRSERRRERGGFVSPAPMPELVYDLFESVSSLPAAIVVERIQAIDGVAGPTGAIKNNVYTALKRLVNRGKLKRDGSGMYSRTDGAEGSLNGHTVSDPNAGEGHYPSLIFNPQPAQAE